MPDTLPSTQKQNEFMKKLTNIQGRVLLQLRKTHPAPDHFVRSLDKTLLILEDRGYVIRDGKSAFGAPMWKLTLAGVNTSTKEAYVREHDRNVWHRVSPTSTVGDLMCGARVIGSPRVIYMHDAPPSPTLVCEGCTARHLGQVRGKHTTPHVKQPEPSLASHPPGLQAAINVITEANKPLCGILTWDHSACERARGHDGKCDSSPVYPPDLLLRHLRAMYAAFRRAQRERDEAPEAVCRRLIQWMADPKRAPSSTFSDTPEGTVMLGIELMLKDKAEATRRGVRDDGVMPREEAVRFLQEKARAAEGLPPLLASTPTAYMLAGCPAGNPECPAERMPVEVNSPAWTTRETCPVCRAPDRRTRTTP